MKRVDDDFSKVSTNELRDGLLNAVLNGFENAETRRRTRCYYSLLTRPELLEKAQSIGYILLDDKPVTRSDIELRREKHMCEHWHPPVRKPVAKDVRVPVMPVAMSPDEAFVMELLNKPYIRSAVVICTGVVGFKYEADATEQQKSKLPLTIKRMKYEGQVIHG